MHADGHLGDAERPLVGRVVRRWLLAALVVGSFACSVPTRVEAEPLAVDYRCGGEIVLADGAPADGWAHAAGGRLPARAGTPCWVRIDVSRLAPRVLEVGGADGYEGVALYDAHGEALAKVHDFGARRNAIVGSGGSDGSMLFPTLQTASSPVYARVERSRFAVVFGAVDLTRAIQDERDFDFLHFGLAVTCGLIALIGAGLAIALRDRGQWWYACYFAFLIVDELLLTNVVFALAPDFAAARPIARAFYPVSQAVETVIFAVLLRSGERSRAGTPGISRSPSRWWRRDRSDSSTAFRRASSTASTRAPAPRSSSSIDRGASGGSAIASAS